MEDLNNNVISYSLFEKKTTQRIEDIRRYYKQTLYLECIFISTECIVISTLLSTLLSECIVISTLLSECIVISTLQKRYMED